MPFSLITSIINSTGEGVSRKDVVFLSYPDFKTQIKKIRKEAIKLGFAISTMDGYQKIWNKFIEWKQEEHFVYREEDYNRFLLEYYSFDVSTYTSKSKSRYQQLMRSKRILDNFNTYKKCIQRRCLPNALYCEYPKEWSPIVEKYLTYCKQEKYNADHSIKIKQDYLIRLLSYFSQHGIIELKDLCSQNIISFVNEVIEKGNISKRRNFYILRDFLQYLFIEGILEGDLSIYIPKIKSTKRKKLPVYFKQEEIEEKLKVIPRERKVEKRDYAIILIAARLGLRISDILNIRLKDIDWEHHCLNIIQPKTTHLNILPLSKEIGWAIIDYTQHARPTCKNEYLFVKMKYPFEKMEYFHNFTKYFVTEEIENTKKGIHNLRHSLAKNMLDQEIPLHTISSILGHNSLETTSNTYLSIDTNHLKGCSLEVEE